MTNEKLELLKQIEKDIYVCSLESTFLEDVKSCAIHEAIEELEKQRWIPVSERLPEGMGTYMTTIDYGKHGLATGQRYYYGQGLWEDDCVIAWMPLPEPYSESEVQQ